MLRSLGPLALALCLAVPAVTQEPQPAPTPRADSVRSLDLPEDVASAVVDFLNDPRREQFTGPTRVEADSTLRGDIAVLEGTLTLGGRVEGSVVLVNGDARLLPGATITGDLLVVGGEVHGADRAAVRGEILTYPGRLEYRREGERIRRVRRPAPPRTEVPEAREEGDWGRSDFLVSTGKSYNRVEGLPITFGPRIETAGANPLRVHALAVYRTEAGLTLDAERMGFYARAEQFLGGHRTLRVGATAHSLIDPIEDWHLTDLENALATFVFHRDFRDYYERRGVGVFAGWDPLSLPVSLGLEARWEKHASQAAGSPWSLIDNADPWRPQPLVAEGDVSTVALNATLDTRSDASDPSTGWYLRGRVEQALDSDLVLPPGFPVTPAGDWLGPLPQGESFGRFSTGTLDLRRYNRVDPRSRLNFRMVLAGSLDGSPLPPQRQHALGGEGSLPGYALFSQDCGARTQVVHRTFVDVSSEVEGQPTFFPRYGCDAVGMLQAEFRGKFAFRLRWDDAPWEEEDDPADEYDDAGPGWDVAPDWSVFVDAGRGWAFDDRRDEETVVDVGVGLLVDRLGLYLAVPLSGSRGVNLFVRLGPRF